MTEMTNSPLSGVGGGGGAYIDGTVDKVSFVIFIIRSVASLSVDRQPRLQYSFTFFNISKSYNDQLVFYCHAEQKWPD